MLLSAIVLGVALIVVPSGDAVDAETHAGVAVPDAYPLWDFEKTPPAAAETPLLDGVRFEVVKRREIEADGYNWLHGMACVWHEGLLYTFWGHNKGSENTPTEVAQGRHSADGGRTWSPVWMIAPHTESEGRSHGVFLSHEGTLWAFLARFGEAFGNLRTEAYVLNSEPADAEDADLDWELRGTIIDGFWPMDEPIRMGDGNWIMAGMDIPDGHRWAWPAVAISRGDDFTAWERILLPVPEDMRNIWGESTVLVDEGEILVIIRARGQHPNAQVSRSLDFGRTWSDVQWTNLPMPCTKAYAGHLSTGQRYLAGTTVRGHGNRRTPLTIAVSKPGEQVFSQVFRIRDAVFPQGPGESAESGRLSYPYAVEHDGYLYVVYSNCGGRGGNRNSGEMAVIPISALAVPE